MEGRRELNFCCNEDNDLYRVVRESCAACRRFDDPRSAVESASPGGCVLILADDYPVPSVRVDQALLDAAAAKDLRLYIEYPASVPGVEFEEPCAATCERVVVTSDAFGPTLERDSILALHSCWFLPTAADGPMMSLAGVAGYRKTPFPLPANAHPLLFELPGRKALVATSKLSSFVTGRYAPTCAWKATWGHILGWLTRSETAPELSWESTVTVQARPNEPLPETAETDALRRCIRWFGDEMLHGDDRGVMEGFTSVIDRRGRQQHQTIWRNDCMAEGAMLMAWKWSMDSDPSARRAACRILDSLWTSPDCVQTDPESPVYGLVNWNPKNPVFYGDDAARAIMPTLAAAGLTGEEKWDEHVLRCLLANMRTTGSLGFRSWRLDYPISFTEGRGWQHYYNEETINYQPHYQAYLWASLLWGYALTGYKGFFERTVNAIGMTMDAYPNWRWTNGLTQELARMMLPLAFLVRIEDTPRHREWLFKIAGELLSHMQPCGAIREHLGPIENGDFPPALSNEIYGTGEAPVIQQNGDAACDLLYTTNFAFLGLHEAAAATGDPDLRKAEDLLADFLCRVQVKSSAHPYLEGAWMRSFDFDLWEHWGSSGDHGWGAWSIESGWTNTWISATLAMRQTGATLFDLTISDRLKAKFAPILKEMMG